MEALRAGLPVVASDVSGISEEVIDGETGYLVQNEDINSVTTSLNRLISDKELRKKMGNNGYQLFKENFTIDQMYDKTLEVYKKALA